MSSNLSPRCQETPNIPPVFDLHLTLELPATKPPQKDEGEDGQTARLI